MNHAVPSIEAGLHRCRQATVEHASAAAVALLALRDDAALAEARALDALRRFNPHAAPLGGLVLTAKACFDVAGWTTHAGSRVLSGRPRAQHDAALVGQLRRQGAVLRAQTNMTEFAYGALGLNPWYGTPLTPLLPDEPHVAGGSSSGAAVSVALGMAHLAVGSDTSGSVRIPSAFCGLAGFKPTKARYPEQGMMPLSASFDVPGLMAGSVATLVMADSAVAGAGADALGTSGLGGLRLAVPDDWLQASLDRAVGRQFESWVAALERLGARVTPLRLPMLPEAGRVASEGGIIAAEAYRFHAGLLADAVEQYDPRVGPRIVLGANVRAHDYLKATDRLAALSRQYAEALCDFDAVLCPTVAMLPPALADLQDDDAYTAANRRAFLLTEFANRLDLPSISLPGNLRDRHPIGLMLTGKRHGDAALLAAAHRIERALTPP